MSAADPESKLIKVTSRDIGEKTTYYLFAQTAGRCEICNDYLIEHHVTGDLGNYAQRGLAAMSPGARPISTTFRTSFSYVTSATSSSTSSGRTIFRCSDCRS
jgi:ribosomal protein S27E